MSIHRAKTFLLPLLFAALQKETYSLNIVQLGDSYASGNGAGNYFGGSCYRSAGNWGNTAANLLNADSYDNQACSGSTVSVLSGQDNTVDASTDVVLLGVGGNDLGFEDVVLQCFIPFYRSHGECNDMMDRSLTRLPTYTADLLDALLDVFDQLNDNAFVILVAYPHITENTAYTANCCDFSNPNWDIINGLRDLGVTIDDAQRDTVSDANNAAGRTFVYFYDDTKALFEGHEPDPDADRVNGNRWIHEYGVEDFEVYHLNSQGHSELGKAVASFVANILPATPTTPPPTETPTTAPPTQPGTTPFPTPAPIAPTNPSGGGATICFSEVAIVQVEGRETPVAMKDLSIGDRVLTSRHVYHPIYAFAHQHRTQSATFLQIHTTNDRDGPLEISAEHMVYKQGQRAPVRADSIRVGDALVAAATTVVTEITTVSRRGLYAPLTQDGMLVVNGVLASNYVDMQQAGSEYAQLKGEIDHVIPLRLADLIHLWLSPLRLVCSCVSSKFCESSYQDPEDGMHGYVVLGLNLVAWGERQPVAFQALLLLLVLALLVAFRTIEVVLGAACSHWQQLALIAAIVASKHFLRGQQSKGASKSKKSIRIARASTATRFVGSSDCEKLLVLKHSVDPPTS